MNKPVWGARFLYIRRNVEKVRGARYILENTVIPVCVGYIHDLCFLFCTKFDVIIIQDAAAVTHLYTLIVI
jgi:hypothetical protein